MGSVWMAPVWAFVVAAVVFGPEKVARFVGSTVPDLGPLWPSLAAGVGIGLISAAVVLIGSGRR